MHYLDTSAFLKLVVEEAHSKSLRRAVVTLIVPSETTFEIARSIGPARLRTLDALHLVTATELGADLESLITYDRRLASGCADLGVPVLAPGESGTWWSD